MTKTWCVRENITVILIIELNMKREILKPENTLKISRVHALFVVVKNHKFSLSK